MSASSSREPGTGGPAATSLYLVVESLHSGTDQRARVECSSVFGKNQSQYLRFPDLDIIAWRDDGDTERLHVWSGRPAEPDHLDRTLYGCRSTIINRDRYDTCQDNGRYYYRCHVLPARPAGAQDANSIPVDGREYMQLTTNSSNGTVFLPPSGRLTIKDSNEMIARLGNTDCYLQAPGSDAQSIAHPRSLIRKIPQTNNASRTIGVFNAHDLFWNRAGVAEVDLSMVSKQDMLSSAPIVPGRRLEVSHEGDIYDVVSGNNTNVPLDNSERLSLSAVRDTQNNCDFRFCSIKHIKDAQGVEKTVNDLVALADGRDLILEGTLRDHRPGVQDTHLRLGRSAASTVAPDVPYVHTG